MQSITREALIRIISLVCTLVLFGVVSCTTTGINRGQLNLISTAQKVEMGN